MVAMKLICLFPYSSKLIKSAYLCLLFPILSLSPSTMTLVHCFPEVTALVHPPTVPSNRWKDLVRKSKVDGGSDIQH